MAYPDPTNPYPNNAYYQLNPTIANILSQNFGLNQNNAQQAVYDTYRNQLMNNFLNSNIPASSNNGTNGAGSAILNNPNDLNFRQALFYNNFLHGQANQNAQQAADQASGANGPDVRGYTPQSPSPSSNNNANGNMQYVRLPTAYALSMNNGQSGGQSVFQINSKYADQFKPYLIDPNNPNAPTFPGVMGRNPLTVGQLQGLQNGQYLY